MTLCGTLQLRDSRAYRPYSPAGVHTYQGLRSMSVCHICVQAKPTHRINPMERIASASRTRKKGTVPFISWRSIRGRRRSPYCSSEIFATFTEGMGFKLMVIVPWPVTVRRSVTIAPTTSVLLPLTPAIFTVSS